MSHYLIHLGRDKKLKKLLDSQEPQRLRKRRNVMVRLCASIMSQQLSVRVAEVIFRRFLDLYGKKEPTPRQILDTPDETLRGIGLSNAKVRYVKNVAAFALEKGMGIAKLDKMSDEEVVEYLIPIKGVGRWTVEMLLMFTLGREDIFAPDDLGIQRAMVTMYKLEHFDKKQLREEMIRISKGWSPFRTYACLHLWDWKDNKPAPDNKTAKGNNSSKDKKPGLRAKGKKLW